MTRPPSSLQALFAEMKRRHVFRVMAVYGIVGFVVLQAVDLLVPALLLPDWTYRLFAVLLLLGFPVALVLAWAFEQTPDGLRRTERADPDELAAIVAQPRSRRWPAGILALLGAALLLGGAWWMGQRSGAGSAAGTAEDALGRRRSLAVLPLATRTAARAGDAGSDDVVIFADGMHDDLLTQLSRIDDLRVISRTSVEEFRDTELNIREIATRLGVNFIVEGAVDRLGDHVRVNVQLIDASSDGHMWASTYDETMTLDNLFAIRDDLTRRIAASLRARLSPEVEAKIEERPTDNPEAFELYTRGRHLWMRGARPDVERAIELFERAVALDQEFAAAHAALAAAHTRLVDYGFVPSSRGIPRVRAAVERALAIDPDHPEALQYRARVEGEDGDLTRARETMDRVLELSPSNARAHFGLGVLYNYLGYEHRALEQIEVAHALDPLAPDVGVGLAEALRNVGRDGEALERASAVLELHPDFEPAASMMAQTLLAVGRGEEAIETLRQKLRRDPESIFTNESLAWTLLRIGRPDEAVEQVIRAAELTPDDFPTQGSLATMMLGAGRFDEAVAAAREYVRLAPQYPSARGLLADALLAVGDTASAVAHLDSASVMEDQSGPPVAEAMFRAGLVDEAVAWSRQLAEEEEESVYRRGAHARLLFETAPWAAHSAEDALRVFDEARRMSAREDHVLWAYGRTLRELGRTDESLAPYQAVVNDQPGSAQAHNLLAWELLIGQRDAEAAGREFRRALELNPEEASAHWGLARVHARAGRADSAHAAMARARQICGTPGCGDGLAVRESWLRALTGDDAGARELLARYESRREHVMWNEWLPVLAATRAELGESDRAFEMLNLAYDLRSTALLELNSEPWFDPLRADPRFDELRRRMELLR